MAAPAPTPFQPAEYSTDSAGDVPLVGDPLIEWLHGFPREQGNDDYTADGEYGKSLVGVLTYVCAGSFLFIFLMWCVNLLSCCQCCRDKLPCCFAIFKNKPKTAGRTTILLFVLAALAATASYFGRNEFNDAVEDMADEMKELGDSFNDLYADAVAMEASSDSITASVNTPACTVAATQSGLEGAATGLASAAATTESLLKGLGDDLYNYAEKMEEDAAEHINLGLMVVVGLVWLNVLLGIVATCTKGCRCDDCCVILIGSISLIVLMVLVSVEMTFAVAISDFCFKGPETSIGLLMNADLINFYTTCNGTNPLDAQFEAAQSSLDTFKTTIDNNGADCDSTLLASISTDTDASKASLTSMEATSGCGMLNPRFTGFLHDILCDEAVRGLFICFLAHAGSGLLLVIAFCCMPCAATAKKEAKDEEGGEKETELSSNPVSQT